jgi:hypothetical protein
MPAVEGSPRQGRQCVNLAYLAGLRLIWFFEATHADRSTMKDDKDKREGQSGRPAKDLRQDRLKLALRENLKRRKSQARGRDDFTTASSNSDDAAPHDGREKTPGK